MKLSKAQQAVLEKAHRDIDKARSLDYPEWLMEINPYYQIPEWMIDESHRCYDPIYAERKRKEFAEAVAREELKKYWEDKRNGIVLTRCNSKTLGKLEEYGLIEIIHDSNGETYGIDIVKVLNY